MNSRRLIGQYYAMTSDKYRMVEEAWEPASGAHNHQRTLAGAPVGTQSVCLLPCRPSLKIDWQTREAVGLEFCVMLLSCIYDIDYAPKYTKLKLKISACQWQLADGACRTVICSCCFVLDPETEPWIQAKELLYEDAYLSTVLDDKKLWFTQMEMVHLIYNEIFFAANSFVCQPTSSQSFQSLTPQSLALAAAAVHRALSAYASGKKATVIFSADEYLGTVCPSLVIKFTPEATASINCVLRGQEMHPTPPCGATQLGLRLLNPHQRSSV